MGAGYFNPRVLQPADFKLWCEPPLTAPDTITDFAFGINKIDLFAARGGAFSAPRSFSRAAPNRMATTLVEVAAVVFTDANGAMSGNQALTANGEALVQATTPTIAGTYLLINNGTAVRSDSDDLMIKLGGTPSWPAFCWGGECRFGVCAGG